MTPGYYPGVKPVQALAALVVELRVRRAQLTPFAKAGLTLLAKQGLAWQTNSNTWAPGNARGGTEEFWQLAKRVGFVDSAGEVTQSARDFARDAFGGGVVTPPQ